MPHVMILDNPLIDFHILYKKNAQITTSAQHQNILGVEPHTRLQIVE
jgi:hypothetical protein